MATTKIEAVHPIGYILTHPDGATTHFRDFNEAFLKYIDFYGWPDGPFLVKENNQYQVRGPKGGFMKLCSTEAEALATAERIVIHDDSKPGRPPMSFNRPTSTLRFIDPNGEIVEVQPQFGESPLQAAANKVSAEFGDFLKDAIAKGAGIPANIINPAAEIPMMSPGTKQLSPMEALGQSIIDMVKRQVPYDTIARRTMEVLIPEAGPDILARTKTLHELGQAMFIKIGGMPQEDSVEQLLEYMTDQERVIDTRRMMTNASDELEPGDRENFMEEMIAELEDVAGVTGLQPLLNDYPHSASMIIRLDMKNLSEESAGESLLTIDQIIKKMKPKGLDKFEVIYHTKEVY